MPDATLVPWRFAFASVIGTSHVVSGDPCQDASRCVTLRLEGAEDDFLIAVACDGAGSAKLSQLGSAATCDFFVERMKVAISENPAIESMTPEAAISCVLEAQENLKTIAGTNGVTVRDLACTLVAAVVGPGGAACFQVGDGVTVVGPRGEPPDEFSWVFWPERGEYANTTTFLSDERLAEHVQYTAIPRAIDEVALLTDGIQNLVLDYKLQSAHGPFFRRMMEPLRMQGVPGAADALSKALSDYLDSPTINSRTDDDKTLIIASRRAGVLSP